MIVWCGSILYGCAGCSSGVSRVGSFGSLVYSGGECGSVVYSSGRCVDAYRRA